MKLSNSDIAGFLKAPPPGCRGTLVYGPDGGLVRERADILSKTVVPDLLDPFNVIELTETQLLEDEARLADELSAMSLMGGRRLVRLREAGDKSAPIIASALNHAGGFLPGRAGRRLSSQGAKRLGSIVAVAEDATRESQ